MGFRISLSFLLHLSMKIILPNSPRCEARFLQRHIWGYSVCLYLIKRMPGLYGLKKSLLPSDVKDNISKLQIILAFLLDSFFYTIYLLTIKGRKMVSKHATINSCIDFSITPDKDYGLCKT